MKSKSMEGILSKRTSFDWLLGMTSPPIISFEMRDCDWLEVPFGTFGASPAVMVPSPIGLVRVTALKGGNVSNSPNLQSLAELQ